MSELILVKFFVEYGRMGTTEEDLDNLIDKVVYFGEILGKHSNVDCKLRRNDFRVLTREQEFILQCQEIFGGDTISGLNPFNYLEE